MSYRATIGLEIHAELRTKTKMFCDSPNAPHETAPNANTCPVCLAHPGTLPTINKEAVQQVLRVGVAVGGVLADETEFDRKSYFYPDIPKGYQISQYEQPLVSGGALAGVPITRIHMEEDTARSSHADGKSLIDFNRAGVPLMELVTEPAIHDAKTASAFARELQLLLRTLGASDANLEKGEMRIEANISVSKTDELGTKVEVKNLNSFRSVERAIAYELARQEEVLEQGGTLVQETRGWDENKQVTFAQRIKEGSADYRYFPEPDLPKMRLSSLPEFTEEVIRKTLPELPWERRARYEALGLKSDDADYLVSEQGDFFDAVLALLPASDSLALLAANYIVSDVAGWRAKNDSLNSKLTPDSFATLIRMVDEESISSRGAKDILLILLVEGGDPKVVANDKGLLQVSDPSMLSDIVEKVTSENGSVVAEYRAGKESALQFLVGHAMRETKGAGNPSVLRTLIEERIRA